jgi:hypothetical protein
MPKRPAKSVEVQEALFAYDEKRHPWETKGIFSEHYLQSRLKDSPYWPTDDYARPIFEFASEIWRKRHIGLAKGNEETTRREFLEKILERLGFSFYSNLGLPESERAQTPDYLLFEDEETKERVFNEDIEVKHQAAIGLMEAKKVNHPLDQVSKKETPGKFPHQQMKDYLQQAINKTGEAYFRWGILSNGNIWRLYCRDAHPSAYFEFHLAGPEEYFCTYDDFIIFMTLFQPQVFIKKDGRCALDEIREEAISFQTTLEEDLRKRIFTVVVDLANGFWQFKENKLTEKDLPDLYNNCLIFLYRLLFILYAEGRGLLPVKLSGPGSNKPYRERFSLQRLNVRLKKASEFQSNTFTDLYEELLKLFHLINGDKPKLNTECGVPRYNGGLFNPTNHPRLEAWRVGEKALAEVLRALMFSSGHTERNKQQEFEWGTIDYADLEVRQLGDIYEGLLGGHLELQSDKLVLLSERGELQISGTFYTPDWVVRFLVEKTLKPLIEEIEKHEDVQNAQNKKKKDNSFAFKVLKLNILDNAMGSGHFLVRATEWLADQIVYSPTTRFQIDKVPSGISQEQAELAYWRRRVVEACIYGVDSNLLAVELTKLSLWLTCIASNEPLNFLDHHLRVGNSLIGAKLHELSVLPIHQKEEQIHFTFGTNLTRVVSDAIKEIEAIEEEASTEIEIVKKKEDRWRDKIIRRLDPFRDVANLWITAASGLDINESEYNLLASGIVAPPRPQSKEMQAFKSTLDKFEDNYQRIIKNLMPFHWELEFPDVFFHDDGTVKDNPGFDAILGNPPYISTQTSSEFEYRNALDQRFGFVDDLYVHFVFQGFKLLRNGGTFGYIVSDTFFTLATKLRLRELLQRNRLFYLGQCDPFTATVDAAIFVAQKDDKKTDYDVQFIQARYATEGSTPDKELAALATKPTPLLINGTAPIEVEGDKRQVLRGIQGCLRLHRIGVDAYRSAVKSAFFEPTEAITLLYNRFNEPLKKLAATWWEKIETSSKFDKHRDHIIRYQSSLKTGSVTLVGLIAEGAQGLGTGNNGKYLGYIEHSESAEEALNRKRKLMELWRSTTRFSGTLKEVIEKYGDDFDSIAEEMKIRFASNRESWLGQNVGFKRGEVYRLVKKDDLYAIEELDEILRHKIIYEGIETRKCWLPYSKGDKEGNKWINEQDLFINWTKENVIELQTISTARWQGHKYFMKSGVTWSDTGNHVALKARIAQVSIFDVSGMKLSPMIDTVSSHTLLAIMSSNVFSFIIKKFIDHTQKYQINDIRQAPFVIPSKDQAAKLEMLAKRAVEAKELTLKKQDPSAELINDSRQLVKEQQHAPKYLQPKPQLLLLNSSEECLHAVELAIQWEVEKLYGVEGMGPFDEF